MKRAKRKVTYHGRSGRPVLHKAKSGHRFIMVRKPGGGVKRLYEGTKYAVNKARTAFKRLRLG